MYTNPYDLYKQQDLDTCNKQELVGKLFNEGSLSLKRAVIEIGKKRYDLANENIKKAEVIVSTLNNSLDMKYAIAIQLRSLYKYMLRRMIDGNIKKDVAILEEISGMFSELRDTWNQAIILSKKPQSI